MKVLETLRNEFEVELAAKDARILQVGPHPPRPPHPHAFTSSFQLQHNNSQLCIAAEDQSQSLGGPTEFHSQLDETPRVLQQSYKKTTNL